MADTVFFSWQADTPTLGGRNFIERALERAIARISEDVQIEEAVRNGLELDKDTKGVAGQPPIVDTIFKKVDAASAFVPDLTFVGHRIDGRPTPNPNVLIEYGWALKSLGHGRIVPVMNIAYGKPVGEAMPFDMRHLRNPILFDLPADASDEKRKEVRDKLASDLQDHLKSVFESEGVRSRETKAQVSPFKSAETLSGPARFRSPGSPLGVKDSLRFLKQPSDVFLADGPALWLRVMPSVSPERSWTAVELEKAGAHDDFLLMPLLESVRDLGFLRADDGFGVFAATTDPKTSAVTFAFESGELWAIDAYLISAVRTHGDGRGRSGLPSLEVELVRAMARFTRFLDRIGVKPPYRWITGIEGMKGLGLHYPAPSGQSWSMQGPFGNCVADVISEEGLIAVGESPSQALKPFFLKMFAKCGLERPAYLDEIARTA